MVSGEALQSQRQSKKETALDEINNCRLSIMDPLSLLPEKKKKKTILKHKAGVVLMDWCCTVIDPFPWKYEGKGIKNGL